jgi:hypothetical protein
MGRRFGVAVVKRKRKLWQELVVVLLIVIPIMGLVWWPILTSDTKPWETGRPIPVEAPSEERRLHHDAGVSIIVPPNWKEWVNDEPAMIQLNPRQVTAGRSKAGMGITLLLEQPSELAQCTETQFQGQPAHLKVERRRSTFDDPALTTWTIYVQHDDNWFAVSYFIAEAHDEIPEMGKRYLETVRFSAD